MPRRLLRFPALLVFLVPGLLLPACTSGKAAGSSGTPSGGAQPSGQYSGVSPVPPVPASPGQPIVLGPSGLGVAQAGESQPSAVAAVTALLGQPGITAGDCPGTTEVEWGDLSLEFAGGILQGYRYNPGGLSAFGSTPPPSLSGSPPLATATGATLGMTLAKVRPMYAANDFSEEQGGAIVVTGTVSGQRLFLGFFESDPSTPLAEIKGGATCGDF